MTHIPPGIGRKIWYHAPHEAIHKDPSQPLDATICYIHSDQLVNLRVTDQEGHSHVRNSVRLLQDTEDKPDEGVPYCYWMPFQIGQAKRYEGRDNPPDNPPTQQANAANQVGEGQEGLG